MSQYQGSVRWFNNAKGYGFLGRDSGPDVFVHYSAIQADGYKTLKEGDLVEYDVIQGNQGLQADKVRRVRADAAAHQGRPAADPALLKPDMVLPSRAA